MKNVTSPSRPGPARQRAPRLRGRPDALVPAHAEGACACAFFSPRAGRGRALARRRGRAPAACVPRAPTHSPGATSEHPHGRGRARVAARPRAVRMRVPRAPARSLARAHSLVYSPGATSESAALTNAGAAAPTSLLSRAGMIPSQWLTAERFCRLAPPPRGGWIYPISPLSDISDLCALRYIRSLRSPIYPISPLSDISDLSALRGRVARGPAPLSSPSLQVGFKGRARRIRLGLEFDVLNVGQLQAGGRSVMPMCHAMRHVIIHMSWHGVCHTICHVS